MALGTEGGDALAYRARSADWVPQWLGRNEHWPFLPELHRSHGFLDCLEWPAYRDDGLEVRVPGLAEGDRFQCQFLCAWASWKEDEIATWFAVERRPREILRSLEFELRTCRSGGVLVSGANNPDAAWHGRWPRS